MNYQNTTRSQYEEQGASNNYLLADRNYEKISEKTLLDVLNRHSLKKAILGRKRVKQEELRDSLIGVHSEWHHCGDNYKKAFFYQRSWVDQYLNDEYLAKFFNEIMSKRERESAMEKELIVKCYDNCEVKMIDYVKSGKRFKRKEKVYDNCLIRVCNGYTDIETKYSSFSFSPQKRNFFIQSSTEITERQYKIRLKKRKTIKFDLKNGH